MKAQGEEARVEENEDEDRRRREALFGAEARARGKRGGEEREKSGEGQRETNEERGGVPGRSSQRVDHSNCKSTTWDCPNLRP